MNIHAAYSGDKETTLLQHSHMDGGWWEDGSLQYDAIKFPLFEKAKRIAINMVAGDQLFIPAMYWHWVFSGEGCVAAQVFHDAPVESHREDSDTAEYLTNNGMEEGRKRSVPVLMQQGAAHWPAMEWTVQSVLTLPGLTRFLYSHGKSLCPLEKPHPYYEDTGLQSTDVASLSRLVACQNDGVGYQWALPLTPALSTAISQIRIPPSVDPRSISNINVWCNTRQCHTGLHYDLQDNVLSCLRGEKRVVLFPQSESKYLYHLPFERDAVKAWRV